MHEIYPLVPTSIWMRRFHCFRRPDAGKRRTELRSDFSGAVLDAKTEGCKLFNIAGDLFDDEFVTKDTMEMLVHEFSAFPPATLSLLRAITTPIPSVRRTSSPNGRKMSTFSPRPK